MGIFNFLKTKGLSPASRTPVITGQTVMGNYLKTSAVDGYASNADVYAIISLLARKASSIPWYVYKKKTDKGSRIALDRYKSLTKGLHSFDVYQEALKWREKAMDDVVEDSDLARLIARPNPTQGQDKFFESLCVWYWLTGEGFVWGNDGNSDNPTAPIVEMFPLPSQAMDHVLDAADIFGVAGWKLMVGQGIYLPKEDVCQWKMANPLVTDDHVGIRGLSPIQAAYRTMMMGAEAENAAWAMAKNGGSKGLLTPEPVGNIVPNFSREQADRIKEYLNRYINGSANSGNISVAETPWKYQSFGMSSVDMQLLESQKLTLEKLCRVFGVPVVLFSPDNMADNNYQNALRDLVTNTIVPAIASLRDELNRWLVKRNGSSVEFIDFDIQALPELQRDIEKLVSGLVGASWLTLDEKREAMGYEPMGGAAAKIYVNSGLVSLDELSLDITDGEDPGDAIGGLGQV